MSCGVKIRHVVKESVFFKAGLRRGDVVTSINGEEIADELDFKFFAADYLLDLSVLRGGQVLGLNVTRHEGSFLDVDIYEKPINTCKNRCIFCFIDQMPPGLRSALYIKDEDFRHSFLNGNYVTLSNATSNDLHKLARLGISPVFISVHATDTSVRNKMLRNSKAPPVLEQLRFLKDCGISFHTQIVVCKGYNDGEVLLKTVYDLFSLGQSLLSVAVVPVGLTRFRRFPLKPVDFQCARWICSNVGKASDDYMKKDGFRRLFLADEFFIKAGLPIPPGKYYGDYPQIENGVGLVRKLFNQWRSCKIKLNTGKLTVNSGKKSLILTSVSAFPFLQKIVKYSLKKYPSFDVYIRAVVNDYFGETVTVAGLLTAKDVMRAIKQESKSNRYGQVFIPAAMFNYGGYTIDGFSLGRMRRESGLNIRVAESPDDFFIKKSKGRK